MNFLASSTVKKSSIFVWFVKDQCLEAIVMSSPESENSAVCTCVCMCVFDRQLLFAGLRAVQPDAMTRPQTTTHTVLYITT